MEVLLTKSLRDEVINQGDKSPTEEICGALLGYRNEKSWRIVEAIQLKNTSENKAVHYVPDQNQWYEVLNKTTFLNKDAKLELLGIYHTHPNSEPIASATDINEAGYEGVYWIYSPRYKRSNYYYWDGNEDKRQFKKINVIKELV